MPALPSLIENFAPLARDYDVVLSDVWGVVHNGVRAFTDACDALSRFRAGGGTVLLITNAPRPAGVVVRLLDKLEVPHAAYDGIVSSGDVTQDVMLERRHQRVFTIGPQRDLPTFTELGITFAPAESADYVVCTGLFDDDKETPENYRPLLLRLRERNLFMVCANPDLVVERGERLVYCAGSIADLYASLGGEVLYAGKPHRPIYEAALAKAAAARREAAATGCWRSATRCAPTSPAPPRSASIACSSPPASTPRRRAAGHAGRQAAGVDLRRSRYLSEGGHATAGVVSRDAPYRPKRCPAQGRA